MRMQMPSRPRTRVCNTGGGDLSIAYLRLRLWRRGSGERRAEAFWDIVFSNVRRVRRAPRFGLGGAAASRTRAA